MVVAGGLWLGTSTAAIVLGGEAGTLLLGISSNLLVFYGFYQAWVRQTKDEEDFRQHEREMEDHDESSADAQRRRQHSRARESAAEDEHQLSRELH
jgi:hypothetical protein